MNPFRGHFRDHGHIYIYININQSESNATMTPHSSLSKSLLAVNHY